MGAVWRATHVALGRSVAVKFVLDSAHGAPPPESLQRFLREARSLVVVSYCNVVDVLDFGEDSGRSFFAMECFEGESFAQRLDRKPPPTLVEIVEWMGGTLDKLTAI